MINILMIEDDSDLAEILIEFLAQNSITVTNYEDPFLGLSALSLKKYDLVILDLTLDELDGLDVCKKIREISDIPIIISSARSLVQDKIEALKLGADDYLPKPYDPRELEARILSNVRRYKEFTPKINKPKFTIDKISKTIYKNKQALKLTQAEYEIMEYFLISNKAVLSRQMILDNVTSLSDEADNNSLAVLIGRLRTKIEDDPKEPQHLITMRGLGYKFLY